MPCTLALATTGSPNRAAPIRPHRCARTACGTRTGTGHDMPANGLSTCGRSARLAGKNPAFAFYCFIEMRHE
jgi:hypothetical protein